MKPLFSKRTFLKPFAAFIASASFLLLLLNVSVPSLHSHLHELQDQEQIVSWTEDSHEQDAEFSLFQHQQAESRCHEDEEGLHPAHKHSSTGHSSDCHLCRVLAGFSISLPAHIVSVDMMIKSSTEGIVFNHEIPAALILNPYSHAPPITIS